MLTLCVERIAPKYGALVTVVLMVGILGKPDSCEVIGFGSSFRHKPIKMAHMGPYWDGKTQGWLCGRPDASVHNFTPVCVQTL